MCRDHIPKIKSACAKGPGGQPHLTQAMGGYALVVPMIFDMITIC